MFTGLCFYNYGSNTKWAFEVRWEEWSGEALERDSITLGFFLPGLDCWGQMKAANDSMVAGSRSAGLASRSTSTLSSLFFSPLLPNCLWKICSLWFSGSCEMMAFCLDEEGQMKRALSSLIVFIAQTQLSPPVTLWLSDSTQKESGLGVWPLALLHCRVCSLVLLLLWTVSSKILRHLTKSHITFNSCGVLSHLLLFWSLIGEYFSEERLKLEENIATIPYLWVLLGFVSSYLNYFIWKD